MLTIDLPKLNLQEVYYSFDTLSQTNDPLTTLSQFKEKVFAEFEERELNFQLQYEPMTPFANEEKEIQYVKELKMVGQEMEWGSSIVDLTSDSNSIQETKDVVTKSLPKANHQDKNFFYGIDNQPILKREIKSEPTHQVEPVVKEEQKPVDEKTIKTTMNKFSNGEEITQTKQVEPTEEEMEYNSIDFEEGMTLREFLRKNPTITANDVYQYYSKQEVKKALLLGKIVKRGNKLFI